MMRWVIAALTALQVSAVHADTIRLAATTSFENSGLADVLIPQFEADTGHNLQLLVVGTGQAIRLGEAGDVDAILVHARTAEDAFIALGYGTHRREIMHNDFVLIGPASDPAGVQAAQTVTDAMADIATKMPAFISRGDDSGTHKAEVALWAQIARDPADFGQWYNSVGAGMGAALNTAAGLDAYILADRASWLNFGNKGSLTLLFEGDPQLFNQYTYLPVSPARHSHVNSRAAQALEVWLTSETAKALIDGYRVKDQQLFVFNALPE